MEPNQTITFKDLLGLLVDAVVGEATADWRAEKLQGIISDGINGPAIDIEGHVGHSIMKEVPNLKR